MREIREIKVNIKFFKLTGLLTDIPNLFWEFGFKIARNDMEPSIWEVWKGEKYIESLEFGDYIVLFPKMGLLSVYSEEELRARFEVIE